MHQAKEMIRSSQRSTEACLPSGCQESGYGGDRREARILIVFACKCCAHGIREIFLAPNTIAILRCDFRVEDVSPCAGRVSQRKAGLDLSAISHFVVIIQSIFVWVFTIYSTNTFCFLKARMFVAVCRCAYSNVRGSSASYPALLGCRSLRNIANTDSLRWTSQTYVLSHGHFP